MPRGRKSSGRAASQGTPNPIDVHVGRRVRLRRILLGMSQGNLGDAIGLTYQQVQKYERGADRISSSRLFDLARVLDVPLAYFFDEMSASTSARSPSRLRGMAEQKPLPFKPDPMAKRETLELVRAYYRITDPRVRKRLFELTTSLAKAAGDGPRMILRKRNKSMSRGNRVVFTIVPQADGTYNVEALEASNGGPSEFLDNFRSQAEAEAWIKKLKESRSRK